MKILITPDSFKGSFTSTEAVKAAGNAIREIDASAEIIELPMADGGEGTVDAVLLGRGGEKVTCSVEDPLGRLVQAYYGWMNKEKTAVIETAAASGLPFLTSEELNPRAASSYGTGQLIKDALEKGAETIILGLGGSATVDAGVGLFQALGVKFFNQEEQEIKRVDGRLHLISRVDISELDPRLKQTNVIVASDVTNPLLGDYGTVTVFGPQKGVKAYEFDDFEQGMSHFASLISKTTGHDMTFEAGSGAAGGIGFLLHSLLEVEFRSGIELMMELNKVDAHLEGADLVITGEGKIDGQSLFGKVPVGVARAAKKRLVPVICFAGTIGDDLDQLGKEGISAVVPIVDKPMRMEEAMEHGEELLFKAVKRTVSLLLIGRNIGRE